MSTKEQRIAELKEEMAKHKRAANVYAGCTDGSYECALIQYGYYEAEKELKQLLEGEQ